MTHPASAAFPPVENLATADLQRILAKAPASRLSWSSREVSAWREIQKRKARGEW